MCGYSGQSGVIAVKRVVMESKEGLEIVDLRKTKKIVLAKIKKLRNVILNPAFWGNAAHRYPLSLGARLLMLSLY